MSQARLSALYETIRTNRLVNLWGVGGKLVLEKNLE
jgi:hypothetical protein